MHRPPGFRLEFGSEITSSVVLACIFANKNRLVETRSTLNSATETEAEGNSLRAKQCAGGKKGRLLGKKRRDSVNRDSL